MSHFTLIERDIPVEPLLGQIDANPHLWGSRGARQRGNSPHRDATDIWLRYMDPVLIGRHDIMTRHESVWYPEALTLHGVLPIVHRLRGAIGVPLELGGVLLTRIPAGKCVYEHSDAGPWHAEWYNLKVWIPLRANEQCVNYVENESMVWRVGEGWHHSNMLPHRVVNGGECERICLIVCFRKA
jgi:hypothetical protein